MELTKENKKDFNPEVIKAIEEEYTKKVWKENPEFVVLTDEEAKERLEQYVEESISYFNPSFLANFCDLPIEVFEALEAKNEAVLSLVEKSGGLEAFCEEAESVDGRGHFLSGYDGNEIETELATGETVYIYRTN